MTENDVTIVIGHMTREESEIATGIAIATVNANATATENATATGIATAMRIVMANVVVIVNIMKRSLRFTVNSFVYR